MRFKYLALGLSAWGWICIIPMLYFFSLYIRFPHDSQRGETGELIIWGFILGLISWLGVPVFSFFGRRFLSMKALVVMIVPVSIAWLFLGVYLLAIFFAA
jgi:hypothetical protein